MRRSSALESGLQVFCLKPGMLRNSRKHPRPDFLAVMERENVIGKSGTL
jgi:hypothetical protein